MYIPIRNCLSTAQLSEWHCGDLPNVRKTRGLSTGRFVCNCNALIRALCSAPQCSRECRKDAREITRATRVFANRSSMPPICERETHIDFKTCRLSLFCFRSLNDQVYFALSDGHFRRGVQEVDREGGDFRVSRALLVKHQLSIEALCILFKARRWVRIKKRKTQHRTRHSLYLCPQWFSRQWYTYHCQ